MNCVQSDQKSQERYPRRPAAFAFKFGRLLAKSAAAQEIGTVAAYLLRVIADQEDALRYTKAISFWDVSLMTLVGCSSQKTLASARKKAVDAGWLHYKPGAKGRAGLYWVLIPPHCVSISDDPINDCQWELHSECDVENTPNRGRSYVESGVESGTIVRGNGQPFLPNPIPNPTPNHSTRESALSPDESPSDDARGIGIPEELSNLIDAWNHLPDGIAAKVAKPDSPTILKGWAKMMRDQEAKLHFMDIPAVMSAIERSTFLHGKGWFNFAWMFCKGSDRTTWNVTKLMSGNFIDSGRRGEKSPSMDVGRGQVFDRNSY